MKVSLLREGATQLPCRVASVLGNHLCGLPLRPQIFRLHFLPIARSFKPPPGDAEDQTDIVRIPLEAATGVLKTVPIERYIEASAFFG